MGKALHQIEIVGSVVDAKLQPKLSSRVHAAVRTLGKIANTVWESCSDVSQSPLYDQILQFVLGNLTSNVYVLTLPH